MNPTAFPVCMPASVVEPQGAPTQEGPHTWQHPGMSLRDYFAAKALVGFLSNPAQGYALLDSARDKMLAKESYLLADAMLKARAEGGAA